jgi:hypothetical protein
MWNSKIFYDKTLFVFKTWAMGNSYGSTIKMYWQYGENVHGPYTSYDFRDGCGGVVMMSAAVERVTLAELVHTALQNAWMPLQKEVILG